MRRLSAIVIAGLMVGAMGAPAVGVPPDRYEFAFKSTELYMACDDFEVLGDFVADVNGTIFFDKDGVPIRVTEHWKMDVIVYRADGLGSDLVERDSWNNTFVPPETNPDGPFVSTGITWNLTIPGYGVVYKVTGLQQWDWSQWPPYTATGWNLDSYTAPDADIAICGYFGAMG